MVLNRRNPLQFGYASLTIKTCNHAELLVCRNPLQFGYSLWLSSIIDLQGQKITSQSTPVWILTLTKIEASNYNHIYVAIHSSLDTLVWPYVLFWRRIKNNVAIHSSLDTHSDQDWSLEL